jgi:hypothetical protein
MAANNTTSQTEHNYDRFIAELTALTRKYGVAIQSVGGVYSPTRPTSAVATCTRIFRANNKKPNRFVSRSSQ